MEQVNAVEAQEQVVETIVIEQTDPLLQLAEEIDSTTQKAETTVEAFPDNGTQVGQATMSTPFDELNIAKSRQGNNINVNGKNFKTMEDFNKYMKKLQKKQQKQMHARRPSSLAKLLLSRI